jgi:hypothetical protein
MKMRQYSLAVLVVLGLMAAAGAAWGYTIENELNLNRVSQIVNLRGSSSTGQINFADLLRVMPDGGEVPFTIPSGRLLLITRAYFDLKTTSTEVWTMVHLDPFLYPAAGGGATFIVNGNASHARIISSGCPLGPPSPGSPLYRLRAVSPSGTIIIGDLNVYITGFLLNPNDAGSAINTLLLLE